MEEKVQLMTPWHMEEKIEQMTPWRKEEGKRTSIGHREGKHSVTNFTVVSYGSGASDQSIKLKTNARASWYWFADDCFHPYLPT